MKKVIIIGAGGHAQVTADILQRVKKKYKIQLVGFLDDNQDLHGKEIFDLTVLGNIDKLSNISHESLIIAIGDNHTRMNFYKPLKTRGEEIVTAIHPSAVIAPNVTIGQGSMICAGVVITPGCVIGNNVILNTGCTIDHHNQIADHAHIGPGVHTGGNVSVGKGTLVGIGATVAPGCTIGDWSIVGAGAVVVQKSFPDRALLVGVPAKIARYL